MKNNFPIKELGAVTAVVCHDAGGANIVQAYVNAYPLHNWQPYMLGPASSIWRSSKGKNKAFDELESALHGASVLLSGTSWGSDLEHKARKLSKEKGIHTIAVLDHWVNYTDRFTRQGETVLPDEIFVTDEYAMREAEKCFPSIPVRLYENLYLADQISKISNLTKNPQNILYLLEPIRATWPRNVTGEFEALDYFITHWAALGIPSDTTLCLRPHPSDPPGKYAEWIASHDDRNVMVDNNPSLASALAQARWVVGCETFAMTVALAAGRIVISSLPPWAPPCRLPQKGIIRLSELCDHKK